MSLDNTSGAAHGRRSKFRSLDQAERALAQEKLSRLSADDIVADLRKQGITSLEDLAQKTVAQVQAAGQGGGLSLIDDEIIGYCYKFTTYRPHFGADQLQELEQFVRRG